MLENGSQVAVSDVPLLFTSGEVQRLVGVSQRKLTHWDTTNLVQPHGRAADGSGSRRMYTVTDVVHLKIVIRLRELGMSLQRIRRAYRALADLPDEPAPLTELEIVSDGKRLFVRRTDDRLIDPLARQYALCLPLADLLSEVRLQSSKLGIEDATLLGQGRL